MGMKKVRRRDKQAVTVVAIIVVILCLVLIPKDATTNLDARNTSGSSDAVDMPSVPDGTYPGISTQAQTLNTVPAGSTMEVDFIDVGEGDCIYISTSAGTNILIDAGYSENADRVISYLTEKGVTQIDYVVATHPHLDHIGALPDVMKAFTMGEVWMPTIPDADLPTTTGYISFLTAISEKQIPVKYPRESDVLINQDGLTVTCLTPDDLPNGSMDETDLNIYSLVLRVDFGNNAFLFTGDTQTAVEEEMIAHGSNLDCDVVKISHHGSSDANDPGTLNMESPQYAVICVGTNEYGHPHNVILERLEARGITVLRTDEDGTISITTDGTNLTISE